MIEILFNTTQREEVILGRWQNIFLCEFGGPRKRKIIICEVSI
ncbi:MAG TPA: YjbQ family protein [Candidatus Nanoarchaeia archaeon]|nr:YjbQ family protein [Candidatus Nanoarchaeia archaeon]